MNQFSLQASTRTTLGKKVRALRRKGIMPIHVYGLDGDPLSLQADSESVRLVLDGAGRTSPVSITIDGEEAEITLVREVRQHYVSGAVQHVDFIRVDPDKPVETPVPIVLTGEAPGTRGGAGLVTQGIYHVLIVAKPFEVPQQLIVDVSPLTDTSVSIKVDDLDYPPGVTPTTAGETRVAWIQIPRAQEEEAEEEAIEDAALEGEDGATSEGEGSSRVAGETTQEPSQS